MANATISDALQCGIRAIADFEGIQFVGDWRPSGPQFAPGWEVDARIMHNGDNDADVPRATDWTVVVDEPYPWGDIEFYPRGENTLRATRQHQRFNSPRKKAGERSGQICVSRPKRPGETRGNDREISSETQLRKKVERAIQWLTDAANDTLVFADEPFELPDFPGAFDSKQTVAFVEDSSTLALWEQAPTHGLVEFVRSGTTLFAASFLSNAEKPVRASNKIFLRTVVCAEYGIWLRLDVVPVVQPWHPAESYDELVEIFSRSKRDFHAEISEVATQNRQRLRDKKPHTILLGFPIPDKIGGTKTVMHWQGIRMPPLASTKRVWAVKASPERYALTDRINLEKNPTLEWVRSENWSEQFLTSRGAISDDFRLKQFLVIGAGALGSAVSELLVRAGAQNIVLLDVDRYRAGNGARHTLTLDDVGSPKASAVAARLNSIRPGCTVRGIDVRFPPVNSQVEKQVLCSQIVIDTTGDDCVLEQLAAFLWAKNTRVISLSLGDAAQRLYCYGADTGRFSVADFRESLRPWLEREMAETPADRPQEGIGCWNTVFPARADDITLLASVAVKAIVEPPPHSGTIFQVYEQQREAGVWTGVSLVKTILL